MAIKIDYTHSFISEAQLKNKEEEIKLAHSKLHNKSGAGSEYLGWLNKNSQGDMAEVEKIKALAEKIRNSCEVFIVIGIGGSYLGARAVIESIFGDFGKDKSSPEIIYAGQNMSGDYLAELLEYIEDKEVAVNVISKSGRTLESAVAFRFIRNFMEKKYASEAKNRIIVTTDREKGLLRHLAEEKSYETLVVPEDIGGRYSVLTAVGLLPMAVAKVDINKLLQGARAAELEYSNENLLENSCYKYALIRNILYNMGKEIELMVSYNPKLEYFIQWFRQLFAESHGKNGMGIFPVGSLFTTDLHSVGQMIQEGRRNLFETTIKINNSKNTLTIEKIADNLDELDYLVGKSIDQVNNMAHLGTLKAHEKGLVPNIILEIERLDEENLGSLIYFFEKSCAIEGYLLGINPFDQPGVEEYKKNMQELLNN